jgi:hypothetical protein
MALTAIFYPSYGGPSRLDPHPIDERIRLITPGFTGLRWHKFFYPACFIIACALNGIDFFSLRSMRAIGFVVYLEGAIMGLLMRMGYEKIRWNIFTVHLGTIYRKLNKFYGLKPDEAEEVS